MKSIIILFISLILFLYAGCSNTTDVTNNNNVFVTRSVNDTLSISAVTTNYTVNQDLEMYFSVDSAKLFLGVAGYTSGSGNFKLYKDTTLLYSKDLNTNIQAVQQVVPGKPTKANVTLSNYKGTVSISVTR
jgi:hypothetical protein